MKNRYYIILFIGISLLNLTCSKVDYYFLNEINKHSINNIPSTSTITLGDTLRFDDSLYANVQNYNMDNYQYYVKDYYVADHSGIFNLNFQDIYDNTKNTTITVTNEVTKFAPDNQIVLTGALNFSGVILPYTRVNENVSGDIYYISYNNLIFSMSFDLVLNEDAYDGKQYKCFSKFTNSRQRTTPKINNMALSHPSLGSFYMVPSEKTYIRLMRVSSGKYVFDINNVELHNSSTGTSIFVNANYMN